MGRPVTKGKHKINGLDEELPYQVFYPDKKLRSQTSNVSTLSGVSSEGAISEVGTTLDGKIHVIWDLENEATKEKVGQMLHGEEENPLALAVVAEASMHRGEARTSLTEPCEAGATSLQVASISGFAEGDTIIIDAGTEFEEVNEISGFGSINLTTPLVYGHAAGATVTTEIHHLLARMDKQHRKATLIQPIFGMDQQDPMQQEFDQVMPQGASTPADPEILENPLPPTSTHALAASALALQVPGTPKGVLQRRDLKFKYETGTKVEYYSRSNGLWLPAEVFAKANMVRRSVVDVDTVITYDIHVLGARVQELYDVKFESLRLPFEALEYVDIYSRDAKLPTGGKWLAGRINGPQVSSATMVGYQVLITDTSCGEDTQKVLFTGKVLEMIPATRLRRRYSEGQQIEVYKGAVEGWVKAVVQFGNKEDGSQKGWRDLDVIPDVSGGQEQWLWVPVARITSGDIERQEYAEVELVKSFLIRPRDKSKEAGREVSVL